jgi:hypothetical protein
MYVHYLRKGNVHDVVYVMHAWVLNTNSVSISTYTYVSEPFLYIYVREY